MDFEVFQTSLRLFREWTDNRPGREDTITFHGGEPLLAGIDFYRRALPAVRHEFGNSVQLNMQSNLWALTDEMSELFAKHRVHIGTSLDGPEDINDFQRGRGYFRRTMAGIERLRKFGKTPGAIASFTSRSASRVREVFDFFLEEGINFTPHSTDLPLNFEGDPELFLSPGQYGDLLIELLDLYLPHVREIRIDMLDVMIRSISQEQSSLCVFSDCLGGYITVAPDGTLSTCTRFVGHPEFAMGNVSSLQSLEEIKATPGWRKLEEWGQAVEKECGDCLHKSICHGGCRYSGFSRSNGRSFRDPNCPAYKRVFDEITSRATADFFTSENRAVLENRPEARDHKFSVSPLLRILYDEHGPYLKTVTAKKCLVFAAMGVEDGRVGLVRLLAETGLDRGPEAAGKFVDAVIRSDFNGPPEKLKNLYLYITNQCNLSCEYCFAGNDTKGNEQHIPPEIVFKVIRQATALLYRKVNFTGGEPLLYPRFPELLERIRREQERRRIVPLCLRSNFSLAIEDSLMDLISRTFQQIVVSIDGDESEHDRRRGAGTYKKAVQNLSRLPERVRRNNVTLAAVCDYARAGEEERATQKSALQSLARELSVHRTRVVPLMPLGRAVDRECAAPPGELEKTNSLSERIEKGFLLNKGRCVRRNLTIKPDGRAFPCHVYDSDEYCLGDIRNKDLPELFGHEIIRDIDRPGLGHFAACDGCSLRYLCVGTCRVWFQATCDSLYANTLSCLREALEVLGIEESTLSEYGLDDILRDSRKHPAG